jgi:iron complex outermembrane receptor protein
MGRHALMMACALGALGFASAAQAATTTATATASDTTATTSMTPSVGDLVVTAEKRESTVQHVPVAISAYGSKERDLVGIDNIDDLTNFTPGLRYSTGLDRVFLRGVGRQTNNLATDPGVATYVDGVYDAATYDAEGDSLFIQRTEVLRGPQGTLYGRNSIGGAIDVISQQPTDTYYAEGRAEIGNYGRYEGEAVVSGPINDNLRFRLGGYYIDQSQGYFSNIGVPAYSSDGNGKQWYIEGQLAGSVGTRFDFWVKANVGDTDTTYGTANDVLPYDNQIIAPASLGINPTFAYNPCFTVSQATACAQSPTGYGIGGSYTQVGKTTTNPGVANPWLINTAQPNSINISPNFGFTWHANYHADGFDVKYLGGWAHHLLVIDDPDVESPVTSLTIPCAVVGPTCQQPFQLLGQTQYIYEEDKYWTSHELDLISTGKGPLQWIVGGYYYHEWYTQFINFPDTSQPQLADPITFLGTPAAANPMHTYYLQGENFSANSYAGFGQVDYQITPAFKFTGGLRYSYDQKDGDEFLREVALGLIVAPNVYGAGTPAFELTGCQTTAVCPTALPGGRPPAGAGPTTGGHTELGEPGVQMRTLDGNWGGVTGTGGIEWDPTDSLLAYAKYSRGYKSGGFNAGTFSLSPEVAPESLDDIEGGVKKTFGGGTLTLDASAYYYWYHNMQIELNQVINGTEQLYLAGLPLAEDWGFELESTWKATPNLQFLLSYAYLNTRIAQAGCQNDSARDYTASDTSCVAGGSPAMGYFSVKGDQLIASPPNKITVNANYTWRFAPGNLTLSVTNTYTDGQYSSLFSTPTYASPGYDNLDLRLLWNDAKDRYTVILFAKNVLNSTEVDYSYPGALYSYGPLAGTPSSFSHSLNAPTTYGVQIQVRFK